MTGDSYAERSEQLDAIDLFCGAGGAGCGMHQAGVEIVASVDQNEAALETHETNLPGGVINHDLSDVDTSIFPRTNVDWVHGSPPCQDFSNAGNRTGREVDTEKNRLVWHFLDWVEELQPKVVTMENVTGMTTIHQHFMSRLREAYRDAGYAMRWRVLNTADFGVPQERRRVICVGVRSDLPKPSRWFPSPTHSEQPQRTLGGGTLSPWKTVGDVFQSIRADGGEQAGHESDPKDVLEEPSRTIDTECYLYKRDGDYYNQTSARVRRLDIPEAARLQSFPDWYDFKGTLTEKRRQVGNAVPPLLQKRIAEHLKDVVGGEA